MSLKYEWIPAEAPVLSCMEASLLWSSSKDTSGATKGGAGVGLVLGMSLVVTTGSGELVRSISKTFLGLWATSVMLSSPTRGTSVLLSSVTGVLTSLLLFWLILLHCTDNGLSGIRKQTGGGGAHNILLFQLFPSCSLSHQGD